MDLPNLALVTFSLVTVGYMLQDEISQHSKNRNTFQIKTKEYQLALKDPKYGIKKQKKGRSCYR